MSALIEGKSDRPTCRRCGKEVTAIYPLRNEDRQRSAWCYKCIIANSAEISERPADFMPVQGDLL